MSETAQKLREARALIERGWGQGCRGTRDGSPCVLRAIELVAGGGYGQHPQLVQPLADAIGTSPDFSIAYWNDRPERTQAEVLAAFDKAIQLAEVS